MPLGKHNRRTDANADYRPPTRWLNVGYLVGLTLIAGLALGTHLIVNQAISEHDGAAATINVAGRQRMLSQRIALFATAYMHKPNAEDRLALLEAVELMATQDAA